MTKRELSQLYHLNREIKYQQDELKQLENPMASQNITGMTHGLGVSNQVANCAEQIEKQKERLSEILTKRTAQQNKLSTYIETIDDSMIRQILTLRYVKCMSWRVVASRVGGSNTEDSVRKIHDRFISKK